jgi:hypothetical protein
VLPSKPDLDNFHFDFDSNGTIVFQPVGASTARKCFEAPGPGGQIVLAECSGAAAQQWTHTSASGQFEWRGAGGGGGSLCLGWEAL